MTQRRPIYAVHGDAGEHLDYAGWVVLTEGIGHHPEHVGGRDYRPFLARDRVPIVRLNNGYGSVGTIPEPAWYEDFAQRCANFVEASQGCSRWIIGNEPNLSVERPGGRPILPSDYARCYNLCRAAIHALPGHADDEVLVAAIGPWNIDTKYPENEGGDWIRYFEDVQWLVADADGFAIHTYMREQSPASVVDSTRMSPPFEFTYWGFRHYTNWMAAIQPAYRGLPCYLTEFCVAGQPWADADTGAVRQAYQEIYTWNDLYPERPILCAAIYRWTTDKWRFDDKPNVQADFATAVECGYTYPDWEDPGEPPIEPPEEETMLRNPSFEEGWHEQGASQLVIPDGWAVEYWEGANPWHRPEIKPNEEFATDGQFSIRAFAPEHSRTRFGIWQEVDAVPGQWYKFSVDVRLESKPDGRLAGYAGIQPWGDSVFKRQMVWGKESQAQLEWRRVEVIAQAFGGKIRVAMGATNDFASRNNTTWWDNAKLELWECDGGTEPPEPEPGECQALTAAETEAIMRRVVREEVPRWMYVPVEME